MGSSLEKKYIEVIEIMLESLLPADEQALQALLQPLRIFIHDIPRFSSNLMFVAKFRTFLQTRDALIAKQAVAAPEVPAKELQAKKTVNQLLDQALELLENALHSSHEIGGDLEHVMATIQQAKTVNNVRALSELVVDAGSRMRSVNQGFQDDVGRLAVALSYYQKQIELLESELTQRRAEAERDHLTRLWNRRMFDRDLEEAVVRAERFLAPLCLLLVDIDHFKAINDEWGHQIGDDVLVNFAGVINSGLREIDRTYRLGGDEFAVIFAGGGFDQARMIAARLHEYVGRNPYLVEKERFQTTISGGLALFRPGESRVAFFKRADDLLYRAKRGGRNRICCDEPAPPSEANAL